MSNAPQVRVKVVGLSMRQGAIVDTLDGIGFEIAESGKTTATIIADSVDAIREALSDERITVPSIGSRAISAFGRKLDDAKVEQVTSVAGIDTVEPVAEQAVDVEVDVVDDEPMVFGSDPIGAIHWGVGQALGEAPKGTKPAKVRVAAIGKLVPSAKLFCSFEGKHASASEINAWIEKQAQRRTKSVPPEVLNGFARSVRAAARRAGKLPKAVERKTSGKKRGSSVRFAIDGEFVPSHRHHLGYCALRFTGTKAEGDEQMKASDLVAYLAKHGITEPTATEWSVELPSGRTLSTTMKEGAEAA